MDLEINTKKRPLCQNENDIVEEDDYLNYTSNLDDKDNTEILENEFLPLELLQEENRLQKEHENIDENALVDKLDEELRRKRYQNLLTLLKSSQQLITKFESRLKIYKQKIIQKELKNADHKSEIINNSSKDFNEEDCYLNLIEQPKLFKGNLKNHQIEGLLWIRTLYENGLNGILADDMGLGKTIQTIVFYCYLIEMKITGPFLVIAPLSTIPNWLSEFSRFAPEIPTVLYHGSAIMRPSIQPELTKLTKVNNIDCFPVVITTYDVIRADIGFLKNIQWKYITIDEGQVVKNVNALVSKCMRQFQCANKLILTGTPIQNNMTELWALLNLLMPKMFTNLEDFNSWFVIDDFFTSNDQIANMAQRDEVLDIMLKILKPFILRREKHETDLSLPPKKEIVIYAPITEIQHALYKATLNRHMEVLLNQKKEKDNVNYEKKPKRKCVEIIKKYTDLRAILQEQKEEINKSSDMAVHLVMVNPMMQLKKIANHPYLVHMPLIPNTREILVNDDIVKVSGKFLVLDALLQKLKLRGHKILLFSTMTQLLDIVEELLIYRSYEYSRLDGSMHIEARIKAINKFNLEDCFIMMLSTRAGGLGLNLTAADTVILFDSDWNPQCDLQAQDRCHRMGQIKPVVVYRLCSKHTVDEKVMQYARAKRKLEKMIIGNGSFNIDTKLTVTDIEKLLKLLESSDSSKTIHSNGLIFTDEELDCLLDRSDMIQSESESKPIITQSADHFKVISTS